MTTWYLHSRPTVFYKCCDNYLCYNHISEGQKSITKHLINLLWNFWVCDNKKINSYYNIGWWSEVIKHDSLSCRRFSHRISSRWTLFSYTVPPLQAPVQEFPYVVPKPFSDLCKSVSQNADKIGLADFKTINPIGIYYECRLL